MEWYKKAYKCNNESNVNEYSLILQNIPSNIYKIDKTYYTLIFM